MNLLRVASRITRASIDIVVEELPDRARYEVQRHQRLEPNVARTPHYVSVPLPEWRWWCPDPNYGWHYAVDDQGYAATPDEAHELGAQHVREFHRLPWRDHAGRITPQTPDAPAPGQQEGTT